DPAPGYMACGNGLRSVIIKPPDMLLAKKWQGCKAEESRVDPLFASERRRADILTPVTPKNLTPRPCAVRRLLLHAPPLDRTCPAYQMRSWRNW
ncbi:MAG: hypothetical protein RIR97_1521, partial [Pseudomonadota bacterium]